ncbi:hypothetical protein LNKW23_09810 [Paralimibaculum aggregatum]|uniref:Sulfotransferase family protein n=1 Tax=Paralimibaculum aggregatum TaxID=3036245 RepID=A0ABQ6LEJ8_9RHOB|nr:hypothetical protein [Limibaculum sp. NKW23]GMG81768.1 hypothetical protein LNKW23_09810 [Limibaculum sp. NKW23]
MTGPQMPWICLVSVPRSGTNHICRLLERLGWLRVYLEIFDPGGPSWLDAEALAALARATGLDLARAKDPRLGAWVHARPAETLAALEHAAAPGQRACLVKLFHDHLAPERVAETFLRRAETRFLFVRRRPIDSYISLVKARHVGRWLGVPTTDLRLPIEADAFCRWHDSASRWFARMEALAAAAGRPASTVIYERDIHPSDLTTLRGLANRLGQLGLPGHLPARLIAEHGAKRLIAAGAGLVGRESPWPPALGIDRQDTAASCAEKVSNWARFEADLARLPGGLDRLERYCADG